MNKLIPLILGIMLVVSCDKSSTDSDKDKEPEVSSFKSVNVKEQGKHYFSFADNSGTTTEPAQWDIAFGLVPLTVETAPCQFFTMPNDPVIFTGSGTSIAIVDAATLEEVSEVPANSNFIADDTEGAAFIGKDWFDDQFSVKPDIYAVKTCVGNYGLLAVKRYDYDPTVHQISNIVWEFKFNDSGATDFAAAVVDSFATGNAYDETRYFSFTDGAVNSFSKCDVKVDGSSLWLGPNVTAKKLENTALGDVANIDGSGMHSDVDPSYVTLGWYNYGDDHSLTPKDYVYIVNTSDGKFPAFKIMNYYDDQGNSGTFTIDWKYLQ